MRMRQNRFVPHVFWTVRETREHAQWRDWFSPRLLYSKRQRVTALSLSPLSICLLAIDHPHDSITLFLSFSPPSTLLRLIPICSSLSTPPLAYSSLFGPFHRYLIFSSLFAPYPLNCFKLEYFSRNEHDHPFPSPFPSSSLFSQQCWPAN